MNRLKISFSVLVLLAVLCITGLVTVHRQCTSFDAQVHRVMETAASGDTAAALKEFDALYAQWEKFHDWTGLFVDGEQLDHIRGELAGLRALIEAEHPEVMARLEALGTLVKELLREEVPEIWHIL